jgi:hypothetical protein
MTDRPIIDDLPDIEEIKDDSPLLDAPRRVNGATPARTSRTKTKPAPTYRKGALIEPLERFYATAAIGLLPFAPRTAEILAEQSEKCAQAWDEWAATSPAVRRMLYPLLNVSNGAKVAAAHLPIAIAVYMEIRPESPLVSKLEAYLERMVSGDSPADGE